MVMRNVAFSSRSTRTILSIRLKTSGALAIVGRLGDNGGNAGAAAITGAAAGTGN